MGPAEYLIVAGVVVLLAVGLLVGLVAPRRRRAVAPPPTHAPTPTPTQTPVAEPGDTPASPATPTLERPESAAGLLVRLRARLAGSQGALGRGLLSLLSRDRLDEDTWEALEDTLLTADVGVGPTTELVSKLRTRLRVEGAAAGEARQVLREELLALVDSNLDRSLNLDGEGPAVVLVVGVNGAGKTTSVGKIARVLVAEDRSVLMGAADTFRAAATEQLSSWGRRDGVDVVAGPEGSDPASVAFEAVRSGVEKKIGRAHV